MAIQVVLKAYLEIHIAHYQQLNGNDCVSLRIINSQLKMTMNEMNFTNNGMMTLLTIHYKILK